MLQKLATSLWVMLTSCGQFGFNLLIIMNSDPSRSWQSLQSYRMYLLCIFQAQWYIMSVNHKTTLTGQPQYKWPTIRHEINLHTAKSLTPTFSLFTKNVVSQSFSFMAYANKWHKSQGKKRIMNCHRSCFGSVSQQKVRPLKCHTLKIYI